MVIQILIQMLLQTLFAQNSPPQVYLAKLYRDLLPLGILGLAHFWLAGFAPFLASTHS